MSRSGGLFAADERDWLRLAGGLAFGIGAVVLAFRKLGVLPGGATWSDGALLVVLADPLPLHVIDDALLVEHVGDRVDAVGK